MANRCCCSAAASLRKLSFENQLIVLRRSVSTHAGSKNLNEPPAILRVLVNSLLILQIRRALRTKPTFAEPDELVFKFRFHNACDSWMRYGIAAIERTTNDCMMNPAHPARNYSRMKGL